MSKRTRLNRSNRVMTLTDRSTGGDQRNNYMKKLLMMYEAGLLTKPGQIQHVNIAHVKDCHVFDRGFCDCNPDVTLGETE